MTEETQFERLLEAATRAPSSHNTQPWLFERVGSDRIRLHADRRRALPVNDPGDRELTISCGCALMNLRAAAAAEGLGCDVTLLPSEEDEDLLAEVALRPEAPDGALAGLAAAVADRRTYRKSFAEDGPDLPLADLAEAAQAEGAWLEVVASEEDRRVLAELVAEGDCAQWDDPRWRRELASWMHPRRKGEGLTVPALAAPVARAAVRAFDLGGRVGKMDSGLAEDSPVLAVLGTDGDTARDWLRAGQALERLLLVAVRAGFQASYLNQPVQVSHLRPKLARLLSTAGSPQIVMRLGTPTEDLPQTPRRPLADVEVP